MKKHKNLRNFNRLTDNNFRYSIDCDYDIYCPCEHGSDCCDGDYCRCGQITNARVPTNVNNSYGIALKIVKNQGLTSDFRFYCLERMISCLLRQNPECFNISTGEGYYGEEVYGVNLDWNVANSINAFVEQLDKHKTKPHYRNLVEQALILEYGYVLPTISNKNWEYERVSIKKIKPGNETYKSMDPTTISQYSSKYTRKSEYLSCLCKKISETEFILVDGYHRFAAANKRGDTSMMVMWCNA